MKTLAFEDFVASDKPTFVTIGMFDGVHIGHRRLIEDLRGKSAPFGAETIVVTFLSHPRTVLGNTSGGFALLQSPEKRFAKIASCGVDTLLYLDFTPELAALEASEFLDMLIEEINPKEVLVGYDNRFGKKGSDEFDRIMESGVYRGVKVERSTCKIICQGIEVSSTQIRQALQRGEVKLAAKMLQEAYSIAGTVEEGRKIGRQIGFPTANIRSENNQLLPAEGVYAVRLRLDGNIFDGVANLGAKPTVDATQRTIEAHIFDFHGQIYGKRIEMEFVDFLRKQEKFASLSELKEQIEKDCNEAKLRLGN